MNDVENETLQKTNVQGEAWDCGRNAWLAAMRITALSACVLAMGIAVDARAQTAPPAGQAYATPSTPVQQDVFSKEELAQALAPVALDPDALLAQVLMASTYPGEVADAAKWSKAHPDLEGDAAVKAVATQDWDPSVQALVAFPQAVLMLGHDIAWTQKLGDAFLAQPEAVMDTVQELRRKAQAAGTLKSDQHQTVSQEAATGAAPQTIIIESSEPDVVYVPTYDPSYMYGSWGYPAYPPYYYPPAAYWYPGAALVGGIMWGAGMAIAGGLWGDCDWNNGDIDIDVDNFNNFERNIDRERGERGGNRSDRVADRKSGERGRGDNKFRHDSSRRDGVPYRDQASREKFGNRQPGAENRAGFRGVDAARAQSRDRARPSMERQGLNPARSNQQARDRAATASRDPRSSQAGGGRADRGRSSSGSSSYRQSGGNNMGSRNAARSQYGGGGGSRNNAFSGSRNSGASRSAANRGSASRSGARRSSGGGRSMSRPSRGGGGRRR
jgi:hypothetical protein